MELTLIGKENQSFFRPFLPQEDIMQSDYLIGAVENGRAVAALAASEEDTLLCIRHIQVAEEERRRGVGSALLAGLDEIAWEGRYDAIYCQYLKREEESAADRLFAKNDYEAEEPGSRVYALTLADLRLELFRGTIPEDGAYRPLSRLTSRSWNRFLAKMRAHDSGEDTYPEIRPMQEYDPEYSFLLEREGETLGVVLFSCRDDGYVLEYLGTFGSVQPTEMMGLLKRSYRAIRLRGGDNVRIYINALTETTDKMVQRMTRERVEPLGEAVTRYKVPGL